MKITLVMMVRDEEKTIEDTLRSWLPVADNVVVVDTGSVDGTIGIADVTLLQWRRGNQDEDGNSWCFYRLIKQDWVDYSTNRNQALELAGKEFPGTWLLMVDADTRLHGAEDLRHFLQQMDPGDYDSFQLKTHCGNLTYPMHRIFHAGSGWRYQGLVHEAPVFDSSINREPRLEPGPMIPNCYQEYTGTDGGSESKRRSWKQQIVLLRDGTTGPLPPRSIHYIAQAFACLGDEVTAAQYYDIRFNRRDGYEPERWRAGLCYFRLARKRREGALIDRTVLDELCELRPWRAEPWYELALSQLEDYGEPHKALAYASMAAALPEPAHDQYMIETDVYAYKARLLQARCWEEIGDKSRALRAYQECPIVGPGIAAGDLLFVRQRIAVLTGG